MCTYVPALLQVITAGILSWLEAWAMDLSSHTPHFSPNGLTNYLGWSIFLLVLEG